jgi:putative hydrolase of the HAD superfamily
MMHAAGVKSGIGPDIQGIVFDAVGTLIHPSPSVAEVYASAAARQGVTIDREEVKARFYRQFGDDEVDDQRGPLLTDEPTERKRWRRIVHRVLPEVPDPDRAFGELWEHFGRADSWELDPDAAETIGSLRAAGYRLRIGSNFDGRLRRVLRGLTALRTFDEPILISSEIGFRKPHPTFYEVAAASLNLAPSRILWVGDDVENDYGGPVRAGFAAVLLDREAALADRTIPTVKRLSQLRPVPAAKRQRQ